MKKEILENKIITEIDNKIKDEKELLVVLSDGVLVDRFTQQVGILEIKTSQGKNRCYGCLQRRFYETS